MKLAAVFFLCLTAFLSAFPSDSLQQQIVTKEREELQALKSADYQKFADLIADDAIFLAPQGPAGKAEVVQHAADFKVSEFGMDNMQFVPLSANSGIVIYKLTQLGTSHGREVKLEAYASAVWVERNGKWVCVFSQESPTRK